MDHLEHNPMHSGKIQLELNGQMLQTDIAVEKRKGVQVRPKSNLLESSAPIVVGTRE